VEDPVRASIARKRRRRLAGAQPPAEEPKPEPPLVTQGPRSMPEPRPETADEWFRRRVRGWPRTSWTEPLD
jgi:hypothetical protein